MKLLLMDAMTKRTESASFAGANNHIADCGEKLNSLYFSPQFILDADVLDIVFDGRNKEYGAYELRRSYNRRLVKAIGITSSVLLLFFVGCSVVGRTQGEKVRPNNVEDVNLTAVKDPVAELPPPPPPKPVVPQVAMRVFTVPKIVKEVPENERPPEQEQLEDVKIGTVNVDGAKDDGTVAPPGPVGDGGRGVVEAPKKEDEGAVFVPVEFEAQFPGGLAAWARFLNKNLRYPEDAQNNEIQGRVIVQFVVDRDGNVSDVEAISGPETGGLREEAVRVIKKSGKWVPGNQNGKYVKSYKRQPVNFQMNE
ncbi:MAG TPA: TonB family protein [Puia sp.]|uniref:energy transducer TonB n=1 Tax=Puia sp. TaxID=2045100 RepID=UPI002C612340|nr:TonB family protein [Puia sp.]HVU95961.1 TonB family protein [Puia sp.]